jgi:bacterioferritin-associated ferredoxin
VTSVWVCLCEAVSSGSIVDAIEAGARTVQEVGHANGAGTVCGKCARNIRVLIEEHRAGLTPDKKGWRWKPTGTS